MQFEHDRRPAIVNLVIWTIAAVWLMVLLAFLPEERMLFIVVMGLILAFTVLVIGVSPLLTRHEVIDGKIVIRQGWHSKLVVPMDQVKRLQRLDRIEAKEGVLLDAFNRTLVMTDSRSNGIRLEMREAKRVPAVFWKKVDVVIFDVTDPDRFIAEVARSL
jgi:membrane protein YdbS with pleckstrin-like domain